MSDKAEQLASDHWGYVEGMLLCGNATLTQADINEIKYHYKTAFIHGYKHGQEDGNETNR